MNRQTVGTDGTESCESSRERNLPHVKLKECIMHALNSQTLANLRFCLITRHTQGYFPTTLPHGAGTSKVFVYDAKSGCTLPRGSSSIV